MLLLSGCDLLGEDGPGEPRLEEISGKIVYSAPVERESDGGPQIFVTDGEGTRQLTQLDTPYGHAVAPAWSPDGERIVFGWDPRGTGNEELYVMQADGSEMRPLIEDPPFERKVIGTHPDWSPSGDRVAFHFCITCNLGGVARRQIFVADLQSGTVDTLTGWSSDDVVPTWSPDGEKIAFASDRAYVDSEENRLRNDLYVMDADGSNKRKLAMNVGGGAWSPEGDKIAFTSGPSNTSLFLYDLSNGETRQVADLNLQFVSSPRWHPKGERLLMAGTTPSGDHVFQLISVKGDVLKSVARPVNVGLDDWYVRTMRATRRDLQQQ